MYIHPHTGGGRTFKVSFARYLVPACSGGVRVKRTSGLRPASPENAACDARRQKRQRQCDQAASRHPDPLFAQLFVLEARRGRVDPAVLRLQASSPVGMSCHCSVPFCDCRMAEGPWAIYPPLHAPFRAFLGIEAFLEGPRAPLSGAEGAWALHEIGMDGLDAPVREPTRGQRFFSFQRGKDTDTPCRMISPAGRERREALLPALRAAIRRLAAMGSEHGPGLSPGSALFRRCRFFCGKMVPAAGIEPARDALLCGCTVGARVP